MKVVLYTNSVSAHQLPLARELVRRVGAADFRYVYTTESSGSNQEVRTSEPWITKDDACVEDCEVLIVGGLRPFELMEHRRRRGLKTFYQSERWFKPISIGVGQRCRCNVPGWVRMFVPRYREMAKKFVSWVKSDPNSKVLAIGPRAKKDFLRIGVPVEKIVPWGYFVAPSDHKTNLHCQPQPSTSTSLPLKILWVGRMLHWKRVDTIIRAVRLLPREKYSLTLVGDGPERANLIRLARGLPVTFLPVQPVEAIRNIMRQHDIYILASNATEGWGAALSEALEEGLRAIGTYEAGASAALLPDECLFHSGCSKALAQRIREGVPFVGIREWTARQAVDKLMRWGICN